jgi:hypothetical protein
MPARLQLAVLASVVMLGACSTTPPVYSGFLQDYSALKADKYGKSALLWTEKSSFDWKRYKAVMLDPVVIYHHPEAGSRAIQPEEAQKLALYFREAVIAEFKGTYPVSTVPGPDVLRIRAAITDVVAASPAINVVTTAVAFVPLDMGGASIEVEFLDSVTGGQLAAMVERKTGSPLNLPGGFTELGHAKAAFRDWAVELRTALLTAP